MLSSVGGVAAPVITRQNKAHEFGSGIKQHVMMSEPGYRLLRDVNPNSRAFAPAGTPVRCLFNVIGIAYAILGETVISVSCH